MKNKLFRIYYCKNPFVNKPKNFKEDYILLGDIMAESLEDVYWKMQGENWSPNGEARKLIEHLGLSHTSMSEGDIVEDIGTGTKYVVDWIGWEVFPL